MENSINIKILNNVYDFYLYKKIGIKSEEISVVIQGSINKKYIVKCLKSIKKYLPKAEVILSTWSGEDVEGLETLYDVVLFNNDPGAEIFTPDGKRQNQNRQILSTKNGVNVAKKKYVLKIRSDMELLGCKFLKYFDKYNIRNKQCKILKKRILINSLYTRNSIYKKKKNNIEYEQPYLFHVSDWMMFGLKEDISNVWNIPLAPEPETSQYFVNNATLRHEKGCLTRYHAEQYIWLSFLRKNGIKIDCDNYYSYNSDLKFLSELSIVNNTFLLEYLKEFDIKCQKYPSQFGDSVTMHPFDWYVLYKKYCDSDVEIPIKYTILNDLHLTKSLTKLSKLNLYCSQNYKYIFNVMYKLLLIVFNVLKITVVSIFYLPIVLIKIVKIKIKKD